MQHTIKLLPINPDNWRIPLQVTESQSRFVANTTGILARAYAYREHESTALLIQAEGLVVGMLLYYVWDNAWVISQLLIDERYQGKGYGKAAMELVLAKMQAVGKYTKVFTCYCEGNLAVQKLYADLGFVEYGRDEDEILLCKAL